jgi:Cu/Ag efflux pump CusA
MTGGAFWQPFAFAMIFGLAASTTLTLLIQPAAYLMLERRRRRRIMKRVREAPASAALAAAD